MYERRDQVLLDVEVPSRSREPQVMGYPVARTIAMMGGLNSTVLLMKEGLKGKRKVLYRCFNVLQPVESERFHRHV